MSPRSQLWECVKGVLRVLRSLALCFCVVECSSPLGGALLPLLQPQGAIGFLNV